jgi:hypothetical protein
MYHSQAVLVRHHGKGLRAVGKFTTGARDRKSEDNHCVANWPVIVILDLHDWVAGAGLTDCCTFSLCQDNLYPCWEILRDFPGAPSMANKNSARCQSKIP